MNQGPQPRRVRRQRPVGESSSVDVSRLELPGLLRFLTHPKVFITMGLIFGAAIIVSLAGGFSRSTSSTTSSSGIDQSNAIALPDVARDQGGTPTAPSTSPTVTIKRYSAAPALTIDPTKKYLATIKTTKGDIKIELDPSQAPEAVNAFIFLAQDGYYSGTPFMQTAKNADGSKFTAQAGDPTQTGNGTPGFSIKKEQTNMPFDKGAVGMGGSAENSNGGQFFISLGDYPSLNGKYTIFGQVVSGQDVLDKLSLLDLTSGASASGSGDQIQSVTVTPE